MVAPHNTNTHSTGPASLSSAHMGSRERTRVEGIERASGGWVLGAQAGAGLQADDGSRLYGTPEQKATTTSHDPHRPGSTSDNQRAPTTTAPGSPTHCASGTEHAKYIHDEREPAIRRDAPDGHWATSRTHSEATKRRVISPPFFLWVFFFQGL